MTLTDEEIRAIAHSLAAELRERYPIPAAYEDPLREERAARAAIIAERDAEIEALKARNAEMLAHYEECVQDLARRSAEIDRLQSLESAAREVVRIWDSDCSTAQLLTAVDEGLRRALGGT